MKHIQTLLEIDELKKVGYEVRNVDRAGQRSLHINMKPSQPTSTQGRH